MRLRDGLQYIFSPAIDMPGLTDGQKTSLQTDELITICKINEKSTVLDIGSNQGGVIRGVLNTGCQVYAFEPHPMFFAELSAEFGENSNVHLSNKAVWKLNETKDFYFKRSATARNGGATLMFEKSNITDLSLKVPVDCVDVVEVIGALKSTGNVVLKMDVEGAEYEILNRLYDWGTHKKVDYFFLEDHSRKMLSPQWNSLKSSTLLKYQEAGISLYWW